MMFLSKVMLRSDAGDRRPFWRLIQNCYDVHTLIWDMFADDPDQSRDFLFRTQFNEPLPSFFILSHREPENRFGVWNIRSKRYDPVLEKGQRLSFMLRANPVRTKSGESGRQKRHDVVMESKTRLKQEGVPRDEWPLEAEIVQKAGFAWLATRSESHGFVIQDEMVRADGYMQHRVSKAKGDHDIRFSTIDFSGLLTITEPERFVNMLFTGIGSAKGFGCGLMLIKPVYS